MSSVKVVELLVTSLFMLSILCFLVMVFTMVISGECLLGDSSLDFFRLASLGGGEPLEGPGLDSWPPEEAAAVSRRLEGGEDLRTEGGEDREDFWEGIPSSLRPPRSDLRWSA
jgi:hypothetical protein